MICNWSILTCSRRVVQFLHPRQFCETFESLTILEVMAKPSEENMQRS